VALLARAQSAAIIRYLAVKHNSWLYPTADLKRQANIDVVVEKILGLMQSMMHTCVTYASPHAASDTMVAVMIFECSCGEQVVGGCFAKL
jgi:glutathione S-transferase